MKNFRLVIALFFLSFCFIKANAQLNPYVGFIDKFEVTQGTKITHTSNSTQIKFIVRFLRHSEGSSGWKPFHMNIKLAIAPVQGAAITDYLSEEFTVKGSDFESYQSSIEKTYTIIVNNSKLPIGHYLTLAYNIPNNQSTVYNSYTGYAFEIQPAGGGQTGNGWLFRLPDGKVYSIMGGFARHIQSAATLNGVYDHATYIRNYSSLPSEAPTLGAPIGENTHLLEDVSDGKLYFAEGNYLRHITSVSVARKYHFRIDSNPNIFIANGVSGYTIGPPLQ